MLGRVLAVEGTLRPGETRTLQAPCDVECGVWGVRIEFAPEHGLSVHSLSVAGAQLVVEGEGPVSARMFIPTHSTGPALPLRKGERVAVRLSAEDRTHVRVHFYRAPLPVLELQNRQVMRSLWHSSAACWPKSSTKLGPVVYDGPDDIPMRNRGLGSPDRCPAVDRKGLGVRCYALRGHDDSGSHPAGPYGFSDPEASAVADAAFWWLLMIGSEHVD
jgi:hypothetical protein